MDPFGILAEQYRPMVVTYLTSLTGDAELAEDLVQETFIAACGAMGTFEKGGNFGAWLRGIARNKALENRRAAGRRRVITDTRVVEGMEDVYAALDAPHPHAETWEDRLAVLHDCIAKLSKHLKTAVEQVYMYNKPLKQAAAFLGVSLAAVAQRLHRARGLLRECVSLTLAEGRER